MSDTLRGDRPQRLAGAALGFFGLLAVAMLFFAAARLLEGASVGFTHPLAYLRSLDRAETMGRISDAAQVVADVLSIVITVVAIVVELAATRYTHRITELFVREPINIAVMGLFVLTTISCLWISTSPAPVGGTALLPGAGYLVCMGLITVCLLTLLPYFGYLFRFLSPLNVIIRIRRQAVERVRRARPGARAAVIGAIEELEDIARGGNERADRGISVAAVDALVDLLRAYDGLRRQLPPRWFELGSTLARDPDFVSMAPVVHDEIQEKGTWLETKVLRQLLVLFGESLNGARDVANLIALDTRQLAEERGLSDPDFLTLCIRFFNSYLRAAINARDPRTAYYVLHQYRLLAEAALDRGRGGSAVEVAGFLRLYGLLGFQMGQPFLLEVVAYDLAMLVEHAVKRESPELDALLSLFLEVDRDEEPVSDQQEERLRGVRRAQVQLAAWLLARGDEVRARRIQADMAHERPERLRAIREELEAETRPQYWEFTDRGVNFSYLAPQERACLPRFFSWFEEGTGAA